MTGFAVRAFQVSSLFFLGMQGTLAFGDVYHPPLRRCGAPPALLAVDAGGAANALYFDAASETLSDPVFVGNLPLEGTGPDFMPQKHFFAADWEGDCASEIVVHRDDSMLLLYALGNRGLQSAGNVGYGFAFDKFLVGNWVGDGEKADLVVGTRQDALLLYPFAERSFQSSALTGKMVGQGFAFKDFFLGSWSGDQRTDLVVRTSNNDLLLYPFDSQSLSFQTSAETGKRVGTGFVFRTFFLGDWTEDGVTDLVVRTDSGDLLLYPFENGSFQASPRAGSRVGFGFNFRNVFVRDWNGDGLPDIIAQSDDGTLRYYPFVRNGTFQSSPSTGRILGRYSPAFFLVL